MISTLRSTATVGAAVLASGLFLAPSGAHAGQDASRGRPVDVTVLAPEPDANAGIRGAGWFIDLEVDFHRTVLGDTGFNGLQLTGPAGHNNIPPAPGAFGPGRDDKLPGLVVLTSTTTAALPGFSGPGTNLAGLFNLTGVTNRTSQETELWDTWLVGGAVAGSGVDTVLTVAVVDDLDQDGVYDDAPDVVKDANGDGRIDARDLRALGVASDVVQVSFHISGDPA